jgi:hypothetical protein
MLSEDDLGPADKALLDVLQDGRVTAPYAAEEADYSLQYVRDRLGRLVEHGNARKVYEGLYELVDDPRQITDDVPPEIGDAIDAIEWDGQGGAKTDERVQALASAAALLRERGESAPVVLRRHISTEFDVGLKDSSIQRLLSDNLPKIDAVETESSGQIYVWSGEE